MFICTNKKPHIPPLLVSAPCLMLIKMYELFAQFLLLLLFLMAPGFFCVQRTSQALCGTCNTGTTAAGGDCLMG